MARLRRGWYERIEVPKITLDWVNTHCKHITEREKKLLQTVYYRKLVRRDHLEILLPEYREIPNRTSVINRSINKLYNKLCLDKIHEQAEFMKGNFPCIVSVDKAGAILIDKKYKPRIPRIKRIVNNQIVYYRDIPALYKHIHGINQLEVDTTLFCLQHNYKIVKWILEEDNLKSFIFNKEKYILKPDIFVLINAASKPILFFIEYDTGSENRGYSKSFPVLLEKLDKYQKYKILNGWKDEWWAKKINTGFPLLLFVTEDEKRIEYLKDTGRKMGLNVEAILSNQYNSFLNNIKRGL